MSVEVIQATESNQRKTASKNSQEGCSVLYYETLAGFQLALGLPPPPPRRSAARLERHAHTPVPQAHVDTEWLARTFIASLVGPRPNTLLRHVKPDNEEGETGMLDSASHLGALDHGVGGTLPGLGDLPQAPGAVLALTSQMLPPAPVRTHPGDTPVA